MDRAEASGFGVALAGHALLLGVLSMGFANAVKPPIVNQPMEVSLVEEVALESAAPTPSQAEPAAKLAEIEGPVEPTPPPPMPEPVPQPKAIEPVPAPKPVPAPVPKPLPPKPRAVAKPVPKPVPPKPVAEVKPAPAKPAPAKAKAAPVQKPQPKAAPAAKPTTAKAVARPTGRLGGLLDGISDKETNSRATTPPARAAGPAVEASLSAEVRRQLKPHWQRAVPTGADAESLRTEVAITLARSGAVTAIRIVKTTGQTASNRPQVGLHQERAEKAVKLASPFRLPPEYYDSWRELTVGLDLRLTQ